MPNWCNNDLHLTHDDPEMIKKARDAWESGNFLATLVPEPDYKTVEVKPTFPHIRGNNNPVDPETAWWDWRVQNWGTKWDVGYDSALDNHVQGDDKEMFVYFDSAWSPPTSAYEKLAELGFNKNYGARELQRTIQKYIEDPMSDELLKNNMPKECHFNISYDNKKEKIILNILPVPEHRLPCQNHFLYNHRMAMLDRICYRYLPK